MRFMLSARAESEVRRILSLVQEESSPVLARPVVDRLMALGLPEESEGLLELSLEDGTPAVTRYDIKSIIVGAISLIGGAYAGFWGAVIALAGLWEIWGFREPLPPSECAIVWLLAEAPGSELETENLQATFQAFRSRFFNAPELKGEFDSSLLDLERQGILTRHGTRVALQEIHFLSPT